MTRTMIGEEAGPTTTPVYRDMCRQLVRGQRHLGEQADRDPGGALDLPWAALVGPGGTGDVEVGPRQVASELLEEHCGRDCAAGRPPVLLMSATSLFNCSK